MMAAQPNRALPEAGLVSEGKEKGQATEIDLLLALLSFMPQTMVRRACLPLGTA